jgi:UDP-N-acetylmuramoyl-tripeptide--D-alanyl-D-alanine ligase
MGHDAIQAGLLGLRPVAGRMNKLNGIKQSTIIDDTYNSSPEAAKAALDYLYSQDAPQKIALLGMMNELGGESARFHDELGNYCDPAHLELVVTLGEDANTYLATAAEKRGCVVIRTASPVEAASRISEQMKNGALILAKGSQNGVYAEEAVKRLLANSADQSRLVRQHDYWPAKKAKQFPELTNI